jgi:hypothetical protein
MKHYFIYNSKEQDSEKLMKTPRRERGNIKYKIYHKDCIEVFELFPGEDDVTEIDVKNFYSAEDSEVYYNLKAKRPERDKWQKEQISEFKAGFNRKFRERHGYDPDPAYVEDILNEAFPKNWTASIEELTEGETDDDSLGDKSSIMDSARSIFGEPHKKTPAEERLAELRDTWSESWKEIYDRVLLGGESIVSIARERNVNESAVRKTTNKIRKAIAEDPELNRLMK